MNENGDRSTLITYVAIYAVLLSLVGLLWSVLSHPVAVIIICLLPLGGVLVVKNAFLVVVLFVAFSFFRLHEVIPQLYSLKIPLMLSLASLFALFWHFVVTGKMQLHWSRELTLASCFFLLVLIGVVLASNRPIAIEYFKNIYWKIILMMFAIAWLTREVTHFSAASRIMLVSGVLVGIVAIYNKISGIGLVEETRVTIGRDLGSVLGDPNDLALVLMFPSAFALSLALNRGVGWWTKILATGGIFILFYAIICTQSRGGLLGVLAIFSVFAYGRIRSKALLFCGGAILALVLFAFAGISDRKSGGAGEEGIDASAQGRLYAWEAAFGMAVDNPLTGVGIDNFYANYYFYSQHWDGLNHAVHSTWFGVLAETGFLGLLIFIAFVVRLWLVAKQAVEKIKQSFLPEHDKAEMLSSAQAIYAGLVGTVVSGTFLTHGFTWPIYILAGLIIAMSFWVENNIANQDDANCFANCNG